MGILMRVETLLKYYPYKGINKKGKEIISLPFFTTIK